MDAYANSSFPKLIALLGEKEVVDKFRAEVKVEEKDLEELNAYGEKLHRHLKSAFPSLRE
jgi:hypothetical protein